MVANSYCAVKENTSHAYTYSMIKHLKFLLYKEIFLLYILYAKQMSWYIKKTFLIFYQGAFSEVKLNAID